MDKENEFGNSLSMLLNDIYLIKKSQLWHFVITEKVIFCFKRFILLPTLCSKNRLRPFSYFRKVTFSRKPQIKNSLSQVYLTEDPFFCIFCRCLLPSARSLPHPLPFWCTKVKCFRCHFWKSHHKTKILCNISLWSTPFPQMYHI